jgi:YgiT-type zinc finger domain-containing protein
MVLSKYLNKEEARELKALLTSAGIESVIREHGPSRWLLGGIFCQVQIGRKDFEKAKIISDKLNEQLKEKRDASNILLSSECPECKSKEISIQEKKSIFKKLFYAGVTLRKCSQCGHEWYT